jgi:hypothetical protein
MIELKQVEISLIDIEDAPTNKFQQRSLIETGGNIEPVRLGKLEDRYWVINGRRRLTDLIVNGQTFVLAIVDDDIDNVVGHLQALILNSGKPNQMDESNHIQSLLDSGDYDIKQISKICNMQLQIVYSRLRLQKLIQPFKDLLQKGEINYSAGIVITKLSIEHQQELLESGVKFTYKNVSKFLSEKQSNLIENELEFDLPNMDEVFEKSKIYKLTEEDFDNLRNGGFLMIGSIKVEMDN